ncbi:PLP-dependent aminotransferase family protein [Candidatus Poriferisodalis sp.]|uniref:aminotransferase-like domain-containing protein n=1 Tax=Candidatus Poriferisodalis sp. TaxID=3101277 RepID=UPI003B0219DD
MATNQDDPAQDDLAHAPFDVRSKMASGLPGPAPAWTGSLRFSFVGGNNDAPSVPVGGLAEAAVHALNRHGSALATYNLGDNPQGYGPLREFLAAQLAAEASLPIGSHEVLVVSGSLQALDLVIETFVAPGDVVVAEQATYGGMLSRLRRAGAAVVPAELDDDGIVPQALDALLGRLADEGRLPKLIYTIPTVQNPTGSVMPVERRRLVLDVARRWGVVIFEDDCYADLMWQGVRPPAIAALAREGSDVGRVVYCGSFSKSIAPALRVGFMVAEPPVMSRLVALKDDAGTGAVEQMLLAEYCSAHFVDHVRELRNTLGSKCAAMRDAVDTHFGARSAVAGKLGGPVQVTDPKGGIFVWLTFPAGVDTARYLAPAASRGIQFNEGAAWSVDRAWGARRMRLCFGSLSIEDIHEGVAALAQVIVSNEQAPTDPEPPGCGSLSCP